MFQNCNNCFHQNTRNLCQRIVAHTFEGHFVKYTSGAPGWPLGEMFHLKQAACVTHFLNRYTCLALKAEGAACVHFIEDHF